MPTPNHSDMLQLFYIDSHWPGVPSLSPFCLKLATFLRVAGVPFEPVVENDPRKGPKRKSPWIVDAGQAIGDTQLIIEHIARTRGIDLDVRLDPRDRAVALALRRTFEEHFHQIAEYSLFVLEDGWREFRPHFEFLPSVVRPLIVKLIRKEARKAGFARGVSRHTPEQIAKMAADDLSAAATLLGDQPYFFGAEPTTTDCSLYGFLAITLWAPIQYFAHEELLRHDNLVRFCERMRDRFWAEDAEALVA